MANSNIVITFTREAINGDITSVKRRMIGDPSNFSIENENWINYTRPAKGYIAVPNGGSVVVGANTAYLFAYYFNLDYNGYGIYAIQNPDVNSINQVTILCTNSDWEFYGFVGGTLATAVTTNFVPSTYKLTSATKQTSLVDACSGFGLRVITTEATVRYYLNRVMFEAAYGTDFVIDLPRGVPNYIRLQDVNYVDIWIQGSQTLNLLAANNISLAIIQSISGATVTATVAYADGLTLQYSLDGVVWQSSNIFTGQAEGDYTMYVKDNYGCTKSKTYSIYVRGHRDPFLFISEANAIGFKRQIEWDEYTTFKNDENSLAYQSDDRLLYCSNILFQTLDKTRIQFKSNFSTVSALLRKEDLSEVGLVVEKMSENLDRFTRMDATYYKYKTGKTGIFFDSGWTYTKEGAQIEEYALNGNLPDLALISGLISIDGLGIFKIEEVIFDEAVTKKVIVINNTFEGGYTNTIVESVYDLLPFEVYEFEIDWSLYGEGIYDVAITNVDDYNESIFHLSENISILDKQEDTVAIRYFNNNNRDIFYKYGIRHFIRVPIISIKSVPKDETNISINDDNIVSTKSVVHEAKEFAFGDMIDSIMLKTVIALSCDYVFIQDLGYVKEGSVALENKSITNVYNVRATMLKKGVNYSINAGGETGIDIGSSGATVLLNTGISDLMTASTAKTTPVDTDIFSLFDTVLKKVTWANIKATLSSVFAPISGSDKYIQNQIASAQTASIWISSNIKAGNLDIPNVNLIPAAGIFHGNNYVQIRSGAYGFLINNSANTLSWLAIQGTGKATFASSVTATNFLPIDSQKQVTASYPILDTDNRKTIFFNSATAITVTINTLTTNNFECEFYNLGVGAVTFVNGTATVGYPDGAILNQNKACALIRFMATTTYILKGELVLPIKASKTFAISASFILNNTYNNGVLYLNANATITIPLGLAEDFEWNVITKPGFTLTYVLASGVTALNNTGVTMAEKLMMTGKKIGTSEVYFLIGI